MADKVFRRLGTSFDSSSGLWFTTALSGTLARNEFFGVAAAAEPEGGLIKVWSGVAWEEKPIKVWTGSAWVEKPVKVWTGSAWALT